MTCLSQCSTTKPLMVATCIAMCRWKLLCLLVAVLTAAAQGVDPAAGPAAPPLLTDAEISIQKWAAAAAFIALQTTGGNEEAALITLNTLQKLVFQAINDAANGRPQAAAEKVIANLGSLDLPVNATDIIDRLQRVPQQGVEAFTGPAIVGNATSFFNGLLVVSDPVLFSDTSAKIQQSALGAIIAATGINYSPCLAVVGPVGAALFAQAVSIGPTLISTSSSGGALVTLGVNIAPTLINVGATDSADIAAGVSITPTLISVSPVLEPPDIKVKVDANSTAIDTENIIPRPPEDENKPSEPPKPADPPDPPDPPMPPKPAEGPKPPDLRQPFLPPLRRGLPPAP